MKTHHVQSYAVPSKCATKSLKMKQSPSSGARKIVISSNWLTLFGFTPGNKIEEKSLGAQKGLVIHKASADAHKVKRVYSRSYSRKNNPIETLLQVSSQKLIDESFGKTCLRVHVVFESNKITITPMVGHKEKAIKNLTVKSKYHTFAACTAGVDLHFMAKHGYVCHTALEHRPAEKRDAKRKSPLHETGALTILRNTPEIKHLVNEDINTVSTDMLKSLCKDEPFSLFMASPTCQDFSNVKSKSLKDKSIDDLSSGVDMAYDMLRIIEALAPPVACFENVHGWFKSDIFKMLELRMRRWGYKSNVLLAKASEYGGLTFRPRGYAVFSCLPSPFEFETRSDVAENPWDAIKHLIDDCRDVTGNKSIQDGARNGRLRTLSPESKSCPSILKSQPKMTKDSVCLKVDNKYLWPSESVLKKVMGIGGDFHLDCVSKDIASEIIGQSVDGPFQNMIARSIKRHIDNFVDNFLTESKPKQMSLF